MKNYIIVFFYFYAACTGTLQLSAQEKYLFSVNRAVSFMKYTYNSSYRWKMVEDLRHHADQNKNDTALHAMGMLYAKGTGVERDPDKSRLYFEKASAAGYLKADYNLAMIYRRGIGVEQDFEKAFEYLKRASKSGNSQMVYAVGYFLYKGFGCNQDYEQAIKYFREAAEKDHGYAMYMLGLCYRNGYGVKRDLSEGNYWLLRSKEKKIKISEDELDTDGPENPLEPVVLQTAELKGKQGNAEKYRKVHHAALEADVLTGVYTGTLVTYDWSGKYILEESVLKVNIAPDGDHLRMSWREGDLSEVEAGILLSDTALVFRNAVITRPTHPNRKTNTEWSFVDACLRPSGNDSIFYLSGNLRMYSLEHKEPGRPMYMTLQKQREIPAFSPPEKSHAASGLKRLDIAMTVYPNPCRDYVNISFSMDQRGNCRLHLYNQLGELVHLQEITELDSGRHTYRLPLKLPEGNYVLQLLSEQGAESALLLCEP